MTRALATSIDQFNLYVGSDDITYDVLNATATNSLSISATATNSVLNITATGTGSNTSATQYCSQHNGAALYITLASISFNTATLAVAINAVDPLSGAVFPWVKTSLNGLTTTTQCTVAVFPGISATLAATNTVQINNTMPATWNVTASLTISAVTAAQSGTVTYKIGGSKLW